MALMATRNGRSNRMKNQGPKNFLWLFFSFSNFKKNGYGKTESRASAFSVVIKSNNNKKGMCKSLVFYERAPFFFSRDTFPIEQKTNMGPKE